MKAADRKFDVVDSYFSLLKGLSAADRLALISKLSDSLKSPLSSDDKPLRELFGSFVSNKSAEEIISELNSERHFNRTRDSF